MKRPSFQFYPRDWLIEDIGLRKCCCVARGLWIDMLCLMHQGEPYGHLSTAAGDIELGFLARMTGLTTRQIVRLLAELEAENVFSRSSSGTIFSRRMVRDEEIRDARATSGSQKTDEQTPKNQQKQHKEGGGKVSTSTPPSEAPNVPPPASASASASSKQLVAEPSPPTDPNAFRDLAQAYHELGKPASREDWERAAIAAIAADVGEKEIREMVIPYVREKLAPMHDKTMFTSPENLFKRKPFPWRVREPPIEKPATPWNPDEQKGMTPEEMKRHNPFAYQNWLVSHPEAKTSQ